MLLMFSCSKDELSSESIFKEDNYRYTEFDSWLQRNYVEPYNVRFEYRMPDRETSFNYWVSPPNIKESIMIAKLIKFTTLEAMVEMMSSGDETADPALFVKSYFPKVLYLVGSFEISSSGSTALASAENGLQINILGVNFFEYHKDAERIAVRCFMSLPIFLTVSTALLPSSRTSLSVIMSVTATHHLPTIRIRKDLSAIMPARTTARMWQRPAAV